MAAAAANRVYLSNGAASGSWTTVPAAAITAAGTLVFQAQRYHIRDERASGTTPGNLTASGTWNTRTLNTEKTDDLTITLSGNQFTLAAGTYFLDGYVLYNYDNTVNSGTTIGKTQVRLRNISDSTTTLVGDGSTEESNVGTGNTELRFSNKLYMRGTFTIAGSKIFEVQQYLNFTSGGNGATYKAGSPISSGENEVYADFMVWKLS